jgi:hypothetical protein
MAPVLAKLVKCDLTGKEFGPTNPDTNTRFLVGVISLELLARYFLPVALAEILATVDRQSAIHVSLRKTVPIASPTGKVE